MQYNEIALYCNILVNVVNHRPTLHACISKRIHLESDSNSNY